jgi:glycosyltransferase involved in cell wall biosynthesis
VRFAIITPTIPGRERMLMAALATAWAQDFQDFIHVVLADGESKAREICKAANDIGMNVHFIPFANVQTNDWGTQARNMGLQMVEAEYYVFLDDDNLYYRNYLSTFEECAKRNGNPPMMAQKCHFIKRWEVEQGQNPNAHAWMVLPWHDNYETPEDRFKDHPISPVKGGWDTLNICVRHDIGKKAQFIYKYEHDFYFIEDCIKISGSKPIVAESIGGVHL